MATLAQIRQQYPQYNNLSDQQLSDALYNKFYAGKISRDQFNAKLGVAPTTAPQPVAALNVPGAAPSQNPTASVMQGPETPGAQGNNPMARGTPAPTTGGGLAALPDQFNAFASNMFRSVPVAGPAIEGGMDQAKSWAQTNLLHDPVSAQQLNSEDAAARQRNPVASAAGGFTGSVAPYALAAGFEGPSQALGLSGPLLQRVVASGVSQYGLNTADNLTHGQSPQQALQNAILPSAIAAPLAIFGKGTTNASRDAAAGVLKSAGVPLSAGQQTGSRFLRVAEDELGGGASAAFNDKQGEAFTQASLRTAGVNAPRATPDVMEKAYQDIGNTFNTLAARNTMPMDGQLSGDLGQAVRDYNSVTNPSARAPIIQDTLQDLVDAAKANGNQISGQAFQKMTSKLGSAAKTAISNPQTTTLGQALFGIKNALDGAMERGIAANNPADLGAWQQARQQYKNLIINTKAVSGNTPSAAAGLITPSALATATKSVVGVPGYVRGRGDTNELAHAGMQLMAPLANSNTAIRTWVRGGIPSAMAVGGGLLGNHIDGMAGSAAGIIGGTILPSMMGHALLSAPARAILSSKGTWLPALLGRALTGTALAPQDQ